VQDLITGLFLLLENTVQVGDNVTVSAVRDGLKSFDPHHSSAAGDGSVHIVPFSAVTTLTNSSRGAGNAAVSVNVSYKEDTDRAGQIPRISSLMPASRIPAGDPRRSRTVGRRQGRRLDGVDRWPDSLPTAVAGQCSANSTALKRRFQERRNRNRIAGQTILMQIPVPGRRSLGFNASTGGSLD